MQSNDSIVKPRLLNQRQAGKYLGCCAKTIYNLAKDKKIAVVMVRGIPRYDIQQLDAYIDQQAKGVKIGAD